jgi:hypothetical protein
MRPRSRPAWVTSKTVKTLSNWSASGRTHRAADSLAPAYRPPSPARSAQATAGAFEGLRWTRVNWVGGVAVVLAAVFFS